MTVSASFDYERTANQLVDASLRKLGVLAEGQASSTNQRTTALEALNLMLKTWISDGLVVHQIRTAYIYPEDGTNTFELGNASSDHEWSQELGLTKIATTAAVSGATSLTVATTSAVDVVGTSANSDVLGIELDNGNIDWTTISSGGGTGTLVAAVAITGAAAIGNRIYYFTARSFRPEEVLDLWLVTAATGARREITLTPESTMLGSDQTVEGDPNQWHYHAQLADGLLRLWPRWPNGDTYIEARIVMPFDDVDAITDTLAMPASTYEAIVYGLAVRLAPEYQYPLQERMLLKEEAGAMKDKAFAHLTEKTSIFIQPDTSNG